MPRRRNARAEYEVIVGNIGTIYDGGNYREALKRYRTYVKISKSESGRASGEDVIIMRDGEPVKEYFGSRSSEENPRGGIRAQVRSHYAVQSLMGRWGSFTRKKDAEAAARRQREADRQAGNAPGHVKVVKISGKENPRGSIRAQVRRLPSGQVQLRVPLKRNEDPLKKARQLARMLGRKIASVTRGGR